MHVVTKKRELKIDTDRIEAGELANEIGKFYMQDLDKAIEDGKDLRRDILCFIVIIQKDPADPHKIYIKIGITDRYFDELKESMDFWKYDYKKHKKTLLWSVPGRTEMKNFLKDEQKYSKDIIKWIKLYLKQHPEFDLNDKTGVEAVS